MPASRWAVRSRAALAIAVTATVIAGGSSSAASATPLQDARVQASALAARVKTLQTQVEVATERYDAARAGLDAAISRHVSATQALASAQTSAQDQQTQAALRIRALWQNGGELGLLSTVLKSQDLHDLSSRMMAVQRIVATDQKQVVGAGKAAGRAAALNGQLAQAAQQKAALERTAGQAADAVRAGLAQQQTLLATATTQVRQLAEEQRRQQQAAAEAAFRAMLAAAAEQQRQQELQQNSVGSGEVGTAGLPAATPPSAVAARAITAARTLLGKPYLWGGTGPVGYDCSGLTGFAYQAAGINLPRTAAQQWATGPHPKAADMQPGDLIFWATDPHDMSTIHHVAIYLGDGMMISTNHTGDVARVQPVWLDEFVGATRPDQADSLAVPGPRWAPGG
jgi:cell wall-associated NlpC family hydrolase